MKKRYFLIGWEMITGTHTYIGQFSWIGKVYPSREILFKSIWSDCGIGHFPDPVLNIFEFKNKADYDNFYK